MLDYNDMVIWSKDFELLLNRVGVCNQVLMNTFLHVFYSRGSYTVACGDCALCEFGVYDVSGLRSAFHKVDEWSDCIWHVSRMGCLSSREACV